jgi:hypothetical protein
MNKDTAYLKKKARYDNWRSANKDKQAWHQFNHNRRINKKEEYTFNQYLSLKKNILFLDSRGHLKSSYTKNLD